MVCGGCECTVVGVICSSKVWPVGGWWTLLLVDGR